MSIKQWMGYLTMDFNWNAPLTRLIIYGAILLAVILYGKFARRRAAKNISRTLDDSFQANHIFRQVDAAQFPWLTESFYNRATQDIESAGFHHLADIEDETISSVHPDKRTFVRICVNETGTVRAAIYQIVVGGPQGNPKQRLQTTELITEFSDGTTLSSTTAPANRLLNTPPGQLRENVPPDSTLSQMLPRHMSRIEDYQKSHPDATLELVTNFEQAIAAWQKGIDRQRNRLQSQGGISREELVRMSRGRDGVANQVYDEMQKLK